MPSAGLTNIQYAPSYYVAENGGSVTVSFDVTLDCSPDPPPGGFTWTVTLKDGDGNAVGSRSGSSSYEGVTRVECVWPSPPIPPGGARPYITIAADCVGEMTEGFCTGITRVPHRTSIRAQGSCSRM